VLLFFIDQLEIRQSVTLNHKVVRYSLAFLVIASASVAWEANMGPEIVELKEFTVLGIEARTNNSKEMTGAGIIPKQWDKFFNENIPARIPGKVDSNIVVVYSNYQSDNTGDYDYLIGAKVSDASAIPAGMIAKRVPAGKYAPFTTALGPVGKVVSGKWQEILDLESKSRLGGTRAYKADFEIYDQRSRDPQNSQVDVYIGLK
jgi:predicted transcriptional regulator YdeE